MYEWIGSQDWSELVWVAGWLGALIVFGIVNSPSALIGSRASKEDFLSGIGCFVAGLVIRTQTRMRRFRSFTSPAS